MTDRQTRILASACTAVVVALVVVCMLMMHLSVPANAFKPVTHSDIALDEEFLEFDDLPVAPDYDTPGDASAILPEDSSADSKPAPESGSDVRDSGPAADATPPVASKTPSDMKVPSEPKKNGPAADNAEEQAAREANDRALNAFAGAQGSHNTSTGNDDNGNAGRTDGSAPQGDLSGTASGSVGGGWRIPSYARVASTVTGSIIIQVDIDAEGNPMNATVIGGTPPAATNSNLVNRCLSEVRSKKFTRPASAEASPERARARITYNFK